MSIDALLEDAVWALSEGDLEYTGKLLGEVEEKWDVTTGSERRRYISTADQLSKERQRVRKTAGSCPAEDELSLV